MTAVMEAFFSTVKTELADRFESCGEAKMQLFDYLEVFYNQRRRHSTIGYVSPAVFEGDRRWQVHRVVLAGIHTPTSRLTGGRRTPASLSPNAEDGSSAGRTDEGKPTQLTCPRDRL